VVDAGPERQREPPALWPVRRRPVDVRDGPARLEAIERELHLGLERLEAQGIRRHVEDGLVDPGAHGRAPRRGAGSGGDTGDVDAEVLHRPFGRWRDRLVAHARRAVREPQPIEGDGQSAGSRGRLGRWRVGPLQQVGEVELAGRGADDPDRRSDERDVGQTDLRAKQRGRHQPRIETLRRHEGLGALALGEPELLDREAAGEQVEIDVVQREPEQSPAMHMTLLTCVATSSRRAAAACEVWCRRTMVGSRPIGSNGAGAVRSALPGATVPREPELRRDRASEKKSRRWVFWTTCLAADSSRRRRSTGIS
jgi:hypothetical protein